MAVRDVITSDGSSQKPLGATFQIRCATCNPEDTRKDIKNNHAPLGLSAWSTEHSPSNYSIPHLSRSKQN